MSGIPADSPTDKTTRDVRITVATRHWDHVLPLALGDVQVPGLQLRLARRELTPGFSEPDFDAAECSFSGYVRRVASGDTSLTALPVFIMQGFRHRCVITRQEARFTTLDELAGGTVGLTGWPDSGNVWTRALLRRCGVGLHQVQWRVGPLTDAHPVTDRIGPGGAPQYVRHTDGNGTLLGQLLDGTLDAVMTPFMPPGFYRPDSGLRPVLPDSRSAEEAYFRDVGYVPGMHVLAVQSHVLERHPDLAQQLVDLFERAKQLSFARHTKLQGVLPWMAEEIQRTERVFGSDWMPYGMSASSRMIDDFVAEMHAQLLVEDAPTVSNLFPLPLEPTAAPTTDQPSR